MRKSARRIPVFFFFLFLSFIFYAVFQTALGKNILGEVQLWIHPLQNGMVSLFETAKGKLTKEEALRLEIAQLRSQLVEQRELEKEIQALRDQFAVTTPPSKNLIPAKIVGLMSFLPGLTLPDQLIIDKGEKDGVKKGCMVVYKNTLLGRVTKTSPHLSVVDLTFKKGFSITAQTSQTGALGVVRGLGDGEIILDTVVLSDTLKKGDYVLTKGSMQEDGTGSPPGLIIGTILSLDKKPSALFQTARLLRPLDVTRLSTIFVISAKN